MMKTNETAAEAPTSKALPFPTMPQEVNASYLYSRVTADISRHLKEQHVHFSHFKYSLMKLHWYFYLVSPPSGSERNYTHTA